jgi:hypothetical protein
VLSTRRLQRKVLPAQSRVHSALTGDAPARGGSCRHYHCHCHCHCHSRRSLMDSRADKLTIVKIDNFNDVVVTMYCTVLYAQLSVVCGLWSEWTVDSVVCAKVGNFYKWALPPHSIQTLRHSSARTIVRQPTMARPLGAGVQFRPFGTSYSFSALLHQAKFGLLCELARGPPTFIPAEALRLGERVWIVTRYASCDVCTYASTPALRDLAVGWGAPASVSIAVHCHHIRKQSQRRKATVSADCATREQHARL